MPRHGGTDMRVQLRLVVLMTLLASAWPAFAQVRVSITVAPPPLPVYAQPPCPGDGYFWTPGYWAWDNLTGGYYWVPGTWVLPPAVGLLWTPGYWAWEGPTFVFIAGYWGPVVGFYGGIDYGFGYPGHGYYGGRWTNGRFFYNRNVSNVNVTLVHNTYVEKVAVSGHGNRASYNGGRGGIVARPTARETSAAREKHLAATAAQQQHLRLARSMPELHAAENGGKPPVLATDRPEVLPSRERSASAHTRSLGGVKRAEQTQPLRAASQARLRNDRSRDEHESKTRSSRKRRGKKTDQRRAPREREHR